MVARCTLPSFALALAVASVACVQVGGLGPDSVETQGDGTGVVPSDSPVLSADAAPPEPTLPPLVVDGGGTAPVDHDAGAREACVNPLDLTEADEKIAITLPSAGSSNAIDVACVRLRKGKALRFSGDLAAHPFEVLHLDETRVPDPGKGVEPNSLRIDEVGMFLVRCRVHPLVEHAYVVVVP